MEAEQKSDSMINFLATTKLVLYTVLEFLNEEDLKNLYVSLQRAGTNHHLAICRVVEAYLYIRLYMTGTDRAYYFFVYEQPRFLKIQKPTIAYLVESNNNFNQLFESRERTRKFLTKALAKAQCQQLANQIISISADPQVPMLRLLRETVAAGCSSTFQNFLASLGQDPYSSSLQEYPNLSEFYQQRTNQHYINQFSNIGRSRGRHPDYQKIKRLRLAPYLLTCEDLQAYQLPHNQLHNLIVGLLALADEMAKASAAYISGIEDPFYRLLEFCLRYCLYRNFVICVQEKFAPLFARYSDLYNDYFEGQDIEIPPLTFWRAAYSRWYLTMEKFHKDMTTTYNYCVLDRRLKNLNKKMEKMQENDRPECYSVVRNWVKSINIEGIFLQGKSTNKEIWQLLQQEMVFCINEYSEYQMDISIDQVTVYWCGYSKQKIGVPFLQFESQIVCNNLILVDQLLQCPELRQFPKLVEFIMDSDLNFTQNNRYYKERIMASVFKVTEQKSKEISHGKVCLSFNLQNSDELILQFNHQAERLEEIPDKQSRQLHQIKPLPEEDIIKYMEKHTISTVDESGISLGEEDEYHSDNEEEQEFIQVKVEQIQLFMQDEEEQEFMQVKVEEIQSFMQDEEGDCQNSLFSPVNDNIMTKGL